MAARAFLVDADVAHVAGRAAAPRYTSPWQTMPQPMPVPILMTRKLVSERFSRHSSPSAMRFTSLSTNTGAA
jgi:hypothetical protein